MNLSEIGMLAPHSLWLLLILPLLAVFLHFRSRERTRRLSLLQSMPVVQSGTQTPLALLISLLLVLALLRPYKGYQEIPVRGYAGTVMVLFDISNSMRSDDLPPSRFVFALRKLRDFIDLVAERQPGRSIGIILFSGESYVFAPPTNDYSVLRTYAKSISLDLISRAGSSLDQAIELAIESIKQDRLEGAALLVLSDGESEADIEDQIAKLSRQQIPAFVLGTGTVEGKPIPLGGGVFLKDTRNNIVISKLDESVLRDLSSQTGGLYQRASLGDSDLQNLLNQPGLQIGEQDQETTVRIFQELGPIVCIALLLLLSLQQLASLRRSGAEQQIIAALFFLLMSACSSDLAAEDKGESTNLRSAREAYMQQDYQRAYQIFENATKHSREPAPEVLQGLASAAYKLGKFDQAQQIFSELSKQSKDGRSLYQSFHNLGNTEFYRGNFKAAIDAFETALKIKADSKETTENLEAAKKALERQQQQEQQNSSNEELNEDQQQDSEQQGQSQQNSQQNSQSESNDQSSDKDQQNPNPGEQESAQSDKEGEQSAQDSSPQQTSSSQSEQEEQDRQPSQEGQASSEDETRSAQTGQFQSSQFERQIAEQEAQAWLDSLPDSPVMMQTRKDRSALPRGGQTW